MALERQRGEGAGEAATSHRDGDVPFAMGAGIFGNDGRRRQGERCGLEAEEEGEAGSRSGLRGQEVKRSRRWMTAAAAAGRQGTPSLARRAGCRWCLRRPPPQWQRSRHTGRWRCNWPECCPEPGSLRAAKHTNRQTSLSPLLRFRCNCRLALRVKLCRPRGPPCLAASAIESVRWPKTGIVLPEIPRIHLNP